MIEKETVEDDILKIKSKFDDKYINQMHRVIIDQKNSKTWLRFLGSLFPKLIVEIGKINFEPFYWEYEDIQDYHSIYRFRESVLTYLDVSDITVYQKDL